MSKEKDPALEKAYALESPDDVRDLYSDWASSYDADTVGRFGYVAPRLAAEDFATHASAHDIGPSDRVIDVGCGTGLAGVELAKAGFSNIDGLDLSPDMLEQARSKQVYQGLVEGDLTARLDITDNAYAGALSVGTFTHGHVGPGGLPEVLRIVRPGGVVTFTVNEGVYDTEGYDAALRGLSEAGHAVVLANRHTDYLVHQGIGGFVVSLRVLA